MAFNKTYEDFLNEMKAVEMTKQLIDDDFFLSTILPVAYERTVAKLMDETDEEEDVMLRRWNRLVPTTAFDQHFSWLRAGQSLQGRLGVNAHNISDVFAALYIGSTRDNNEVHIERAMNRWKDAFHLVYT